jgi:hypothetical protein
MVEDFLTNQLTSQVSGSSGKGGQKATCLRRHNRLKDINRGASKWLTTITGKKSSPAVYIQRALEMALA